MMQRPHALFFTMPDPASLILAMKRPLPPLAPRIRGLYNRKGGFGICTRPAFLDFRQKECQNIG
jgi:hypothetical protein